MFQVGQKYVITKLEPDPLQLVSSFRVTFEFFRVNNDILTTDKFHTFS